MGIRLWPLTILRKIIRLYSSRLARENIELQYPDGLKTERTNIYQLIKRRRRRVKRNIKSVHDPASGMPTPTRSIVNSFSTFLRLKYSPLLMDEESIRHMVEAGFSILSTEWRDTIDRPLTSDKLRAAITKGDAQKGSRT